MPELKPTTTPTPTAVAALHTTTAARPTAFAVLLVDAEHRLRAHQDRKKTALSL